MVSSTNAPAPLSIWMDASAGEEGARVALLEETGKERRIVALEIDSPRCVPSAGALFVARIMRERASLGAFELDIGTGKPVFMKNPAPKKGVQKKDLQKKKDQNGEQRDEPRGQEPLALRTGDRILVEWLAPPAGDKHAVVRFMASDACSVEGAPRCVAPAPSALERIKAHPRLVGRKATPVHYESFSLLDLDGQIDTFCQRRVSLGDAASLVFDRTEAAHVIDVNGTGNTQMLNRLAVQEIARQIEVRNLAGIILIDLVGDKKKLASGLCATMREAVRFDPCGVDVYGITKLGLMELTRMRRGWPLSCLCCG